MWEKIVLNLLSNALKHTFEGSISIGLKWCGDRVELRVADTGVGIRQDELPRLFERFHRVKGAKSRSHEGTGIGLALVQELVRLHGGTVHAESGEDRGSTFTVTVKAGRGHLPADRVEGRRTPDPPATRAAAYVEEALNWLPNAREPFNDRPSPPQASGYATERKSDATAGPRQRILWADDNADMREYVRHLLIEHYDVRAVPDGLAALAAAREEPPDLILSDVMMPGLDGFGLLREIRRDALTRTIPVILLSARAGEEALVEGLDTGADDYVSKPFSARELLARVRTHLELARTRREWTSKLERVNAALELLATGNPEAQVSLQALREY
jgi:CheY-like chemotaxis protein